MNMMTPVSPALPIDAATAPVRPVAPISATPDTAGGGDREPDDRDGQSPETTLRYKFDWLLQRQVSAGALSSDKAAEMIRLFERTVAGPESGDGQEKAPTPASATAPPTDANAAVPLDRATPIDQDMADADILVEQLRIQFGSDGPYDDTGNPSASMPVGLVVNDRA